MRKNKLLTALAVTSLCFTAVGASMVMANAASVGSQTITNVLANTPDDRVLLTDFDGNELSIGEGAHNNGNPASKAMLTDGVVDSFWTAKLVDSEGNGKLGYITLDAGAEYVVSSMLVDFVHDWGAKDACVELSTTADFSDSVIVYSNIAGKEFSADSNYATNGPIMNEAWVGNTFNFSPVVARYVRITGNLWNNFTLLNYTSIGEVQLFGVTEGLAVAASVFSGSTVGTNPVELVANDSAAEIYYTLDGSAPNKNSTKYEAPIVVDGTAKIRAVAYKDGEYSQPEDFVFYGEAPFVSENIALGKSVKFYSKDLTREIDYVGINSSEKNSGLITDGSYDPFVSCLQTSELGWAVVDLGEEVYLNKIRVSAWHDNWFGSNEVKLATQADFSDAKQVWYVESMQNSSEGTLGEFAPTKARYVMFYNDHEGSGAFSRYTEIEAWTCSAPEEGEVIPENIALGKSVKLLGLDLTTELTAKGFDACSTGNIGMVTDGDYSPWTSAIYAVDAAGAAAKAWAVIDLGEETWINKILYNFWNNQTFSNIEMKLATSADLSDAKTIYSIGAVTHVANEGSVAEFAPAFGRYLMVYSDTPWGYSVFSEIEAWTCAEDAFFSENVAAGKETTLMSKDLSTELTIKGFNGATDNQVYVTDGAYNPSGCIYPEANGNPSFGWAVIDLGEEVWINKVVYSFWHDQNFVNCEIKLARKADLSDAKSLWTLASMNCTPGEGSVAEFEAAYGRYLMVYAEATAWGNVYSVYTEIEAWTCEAGVLDEDYEYQNYLASVDDVAPIEVYVNKDFADLGLPTSINGMLSTGVAVEIPVTWSCDSYDKTVAGDYTATLVAEYADDVYGLLNVSVNVKVIALDTAALEAALAAATQVDTATMTTSTAATFTSAKAAAEALSGYLTQAQVNEAATALQNAINGLVARGDVTALNTLVAEVNAFTSTNYMSDTWAAVAEALVPAQAAVAEGGNADLTQADVNALVTALQNAKNALVILGNADALSAYYAECKEDVGYSEEDTCGYTKDTFYAYMDKMYDAEEVISAVAEGEVAQTVVDEVLANLQAAVANLVECADLTALQAAVAEAKALKAEDYTASTYEALVAALPAIEAVANKPANEQVQADADKALADLNAVVSALVAAGDQAALKAALDEKGAEVEANYTKATYTAYAEAVWAAKQLKDNAEATVELVNKAIEDLNAAFAALVKVGDREALKAAITAAKAITTDDETAKANLANAIAYAEELFGFSGEITEAQVQEAIAALTAAQNSVPTASDDSSCVSSVEGCVFAVLVAILGMVVIRKKENVNE